MKLTFKILAAASVLALGACSSVGSEGYGFSEYSAVPVKRVSVGDGSMIVSPPRPWNRHRADHVRRRPPGGGLDTERGILDAISFVTGLKDGKSLIRQRRSAGQQVPIFRSNMTPPEVAGDDREPLPGAWRVGRLQDPGLQPRPFLGANGFQLDYEHLDDDELWRRAGRSAR